MLNKIKEWNNTPRTEKIPLFAESIKIRKTGKTRNSVGILLVFCKIFTGIWADRLRNG
jgi:hypothetical protein